MAEVTSLRDAVAGLVHDGDTVALEGFTHLIPHAAGHEIIGGNPGVGSLHRFRDAVEHGWPQPLAIEEHSHAGMAARYVAGASGLPFAVLRGYVGTDLVDHTSTLAPITCPFTGEVLTAVPALNPDVGIIHAQQADRRGNVPSSSPVPTPWCCPPGWSTPSATCPTAPIRASPSATRRGTTTSTRSGTRSPATAIGSRPGSTTT
jgi:acyl CoA:acetate/3-ketoacid CoA transferase alpha subunit